MKEIGITDLLSYKAAWYIYNIDKKRYYLTCSPSQEIIVPLDIKEMYIGILENRLSLIVIKCICTTRIAILPIIIILGNTIIEY